MKITSQALRRINSLKMKDKQKHVWLTKKKNFRGGGGSLYFIKKFPKAFFTSIQPNISPSLLCFFPSLPPEPSEVLHAPMSINQWLFCMLKFLREQEGRRWSCLAAKGTGCSHGGWERSSPGAILGRRLEDLFVQENDRVSLVWSELSQR